MGAQTKPLACERSSMGDGAYHTDSGNGIFAFDGGVEDGVGFVILESPHV